MFRYPSRQQCNDLLNNLKPTDSNFNKECDVLNTLLKQITKEIDTRTEIKQYLTETKNQLDQQLQDSIATVKLTLPGNRTLDNKYNCTNVNKIDTSTIEYEIKLSSIPKDDIISTTTNDIIKILSTKNNITYELTCTYDKTKTNVLTINSIRRN